MSATKKLDKIIKLIDNNLDKSDTKIDDNIGGDSIIEDIMLELFDIGAVKFGEFTLKSGITSPIYIDLRIIISYPVLLSKISTLMYNKISSLKYDILCGVPYTALPIATCISIANNIPMIMKRKEVKKYGTKKSIEGIYKAGQTCLIIEDLITSGTSILETVKELNNVGLKVTDSVVLIDRQQGGINNLENNNINLYSCYTISNMLELLIKHNKIDTKMVDKVKLFLKNNSNVKAKVNKEYKRLSYIDRAKLCTNKITKKLFNIMETKKTNLCISIDLIKCDDILKIIHECGPYICMIKTHIDIIIDFKAEFIDKLIELSTKYNFIIFEDRKFADIGNTVINQFKNGLYNISKWCNITNCHMLPGPSIIDGLLKVSTNNDDNTINHGLLLLAQMSSKDNLLKPEYTNKCIEYANKYKNFVIGFISMNNITPNNPEFVHMTPGVNLQQNGDGIGQQYKTPYKVIYEYNCDIIIVGRGIYKSDNPKENSIKYRDQAWNAYIKSLNDKN